MEFPQILILYNDAHIANFLNFFKKSKILTFRIDNSSVKKNRETNLLVGDLFGLASMPLYASSYIFNARACKTLPSLIVFHCFGFVQMMLYVIYYIVFTNVPWSLLFSMDTTYGFFGWLSPDYIFLSAIVISGFLGIFGVGSYIFLLDYFAPSVVASIFLLQPFIGQIEGVLFGQDGMPGAFAYIGAWIITTGLATMIRGNVLKQREEAQEKEGNIELTEKSLLDDDGQNSKIEV